MYYVIAELLPDGALGFWWQEMGEVRWYQYAPGPAERAAVQRLFLAPPHDEGSSWPLLECDEP